MATREQIEQALADGKLWARMARGNFWVLRRGGATKLWKTKPSAFRIPVRAGLGSTGAITESTVVRMFSETGSLLAHFVICDRNPADA